MKNSSRRIRPSDNSVGSPEVQPKAQIPAESSEDMPAAETAKANESALRRKESSPAKDRDVKYRVRTIRDNGVLLAYITFNYRVFHPAVTARMLLYGALIFVPGFFLKPLWAKVLCFSFGALVVLLGLTRQYISLALTRSRDADYRNKTAFTYDFTSGDASFYRDDQLISYSKYKDISGFYYDDSYFYLVMNARELHILPKERFISGDASDFEEFIYKKSRKTCRWIPNRFKDKMAKRRAVRNIKN